MQTSVSRDNVFFDARLAVRGLGIASATQRLTSALYQSGHVELYLNQSANGWTRKGKAQTILRSGLIDLSPRLDIRTRNASVVHYFGNTAPQVPDARTLITVHDLMSVRSNSLKGRLFRLLLTPGLQRGTNSRIVAISTQTADELISLFPAIRRRVIVIPHGRRGGLFSTEDRTHILMFGGQSDPRKRIGLGFSAYSAYATMDPDPLPLIVLGRAGADTNFVRRQVSSGYVTVEPDPSDERVATLLRTAACVVYPTREEGFGLPIIEAGEVGTPVLCERGARIPSEPCGKHVVHVNGTEPRVWGSAIARAIVKGPIAGSLDHLPTWAQVAKSYNDLYDEVAK